MAGGHAIMALARAIAASSPGDDCAELTTDENADAAVDSRAAQVYELSRPPPPVIRADAADEA